MNSLPLTFAGKCIRIVAFPAYSTILHIVTSMPTLPPAITLRDLSLNRFVVADVLEIWPDGTVVCTTDGFFPIVVLPNGQSVAGNFRKELRSA